MITFEDALENGARILKHAENETNLAAMERLEKLADSWINMAALLHQRESV